MTDQLICRSTAVRKSPVPVLLSALLLTLGFAARIAFPRNGWWALLSFGGGLALTAGLYLAARYLVRRYVYTLAQKDDGQIDFTVTEQNYLRRTTVCRISAAHMLSLQFPTPKKRLRGCRVYHYCADIRPRNACLLTVWDGEGKTAVIRFTPDENFRRTLAMLVPSKKDEEISD